MKIANSHKMNNDTILDQLADLNIPCAAKVLECVERKKLANV